MTFVRTDLDLPLLGLLEVLVGVLVGLLLERADVEVSRLQFLGFVQRLLGVPDHLRGLGVLHDEVDHHLPPLSSTWKSERIEWSVLWYARALPLN